MSVRTIASWELSFGTPLGESVTRFVIHEVDGVAKGYLEGWEGWIPALDLRLDDDAVTFGASWIWPLRFRFPLIDGQVGGEGIATVESGHQVDPQWARLVATAEPAVEPMTDHLWLRSDPGAYHSVLREPAPVDGFTLYRPIGEGLFPVVVWGNGGARASNEEFLTFLTQLAARGFAVLAHGAPQNRFEPPIGDLRALPLVVALDWLQESPDDAETIGLDPSRVAVMGQSGGAMQAWQSAHHPVVKTLGAWNGPAEINGPDSGVAAGITVPTLIVTGGATDMVTPLVEVDWGRLPPDLPAVWLDHSEAGHTGLFHGTSDPAAVRAGAHTLGQEVEVQTSRIAVAWLEWTLNGDTSAREIFAGELPPLATLRYWSIRSRNLR